MTDINKPGISFLRILALASLLIGATGSLVLMFNVGSRLVILLILFAFWVLSPFAGLLVLHLPAKRWSSNIHLWLNWIMIALSLISLVTYAGVLALTHLKPASVFLTIPSFSWFIILTFFLIASRLSIKVRPEK